MTSDKLIELISKYTDLSEEEALELYDAVDTLYNEIKMKYLEILIDPEKNHESYIKLIDLLKTLLRKENRNIEDELQLIALLDIIATDLYDRTIGIVEEREE